MSDSDTPSGDGPGTAFPNPDISFAEQIDRIDGKAAKSLGLDFEQRTDEPNREDNDPKPSELPERPREFNMPTPDGDEVRRQTDEQKYFSTNNESFVESSEKEPLKETLRRAQEKTLSRTFNWNRDRDL